MNSKPFRERMCFDALEEIKRDLPAIMIVILQVSSRALNHAIKYYADVLFPLALQIGLAWSKGILL